MTARRSYVAAAALGVFIAANVPAVSDPSVIRAEPQAWVFPIRLHVGSQNGPVVDDAWIDASLANANQVFGAHGVQFAIHERLTLDARRSRIETARDFLRLPMLADRAQIDVFVVASLGLLPPLPRSGAPTGFCGPEFEGGRQVLVSGVADRDRYTLAHELGHYFGVTHSITPGNIMSPTTDLPQSAPGIAPFFDAAQGARIVEHARRFALAGQPAPIEAQP